MNWVGEAVGVRPEADDGLLYVKKLGRKVAALGGHLELVARLPEKRVTLVREPGPSGPLVADE